MRFQVGVQVLLVIAACTPNNAPSTTTVPVTPPSSTSSPTSQVSPTSTIPFSAANPSQSPEDAARDGVAPLVAAAPAELRINGELSAGDSGWTWVTSRLTDEFVDLTNPGWREYGELLLMEGNRIFRAFPSPGSPLSWLYLANEAVYTGHIGDGALPQSTIMRVDRLTLETEVWLFDTSANLSSDVFPPAWHKTDATNRYEQLVGFAPTFGRLAAQSRMDGVMIDLDAIRGLFDPSLVVSPIDLVQLEAVVRCGITCFEITYRPAASTAKWVYPPEMTLAETVTTTVDCGAQPAEIAVRPVEGLDPAWNGRSTGCEAVLSFGRWAFYSHYFHLTIDNALRFSQTPGPWADPRVNYMRCFGDPASPPACDMGHESDAITLTTIESATVEDTIVTISGTEHDLHGTIGEFTLEIGCDTIVDGESRRGEPWKRVMDACLVAELFANGESFPGVYAVYGDGAGTIWGLDYIGVLPIP